MSTPATNILEVRDLRVHFPVRGGVFRRSIASCKAVDGVNFSIPRGKTLGLVGESGCGKSTLAKAIVRLVRPIAGEIVYNGISDSREVEEANFRRSVQMVFQDPAESLNGRMTVGAIVREPLEIHKVGQDKTRARQVEELLEQVGLPKGSAKKYPFEFSGGQRQRIGIARALSLRPELLVLDEPVSALDVSVQSQVLNLLMDLQRELGLSYLLIAHDLAVVRHVSDLIAVMYLGKIVEMGPIDAIYGNPMHAYTQALLSAIPEPDPGCRKSKVLIKGDLPSPIDPPAGCAFGHRMDSPKHHLSLGRELRMREMEKDHWVLDCPCCVEG